MKRIVVKSLSQMQTLARQVARSLKGGEILLLQGPLGSGKTTFVKALAKTLRIEKTVVSPTFTLCHQYKIPQLSSSAAFRASRGSTPRNWIPDLRTRRIRLWRKVRDDKLRILLHLDCYRLKTPAEFLHLGALERIGEPDTITVIEWPEQIKKYLPRAKQVRLTFAYGKTAKERKVQYKIKFSNG